jgi:hypothetical protein
MVFGVRRTARWTPSSSSKAASCRQAEEDPRYGSWRTLCLDRRSTRFQHARSTSGRSFPFPQAGCISLSRPASSCIQLLPTPELAPNQARPLRRLLAIWTMMPIRVNPSLTLDRGMSDPLVMMGLWGKRRWLRRLRTSRPLLLCSMPRWMSVVRSRSRMLIRWPGWLMGAWTFLPGRGWWRPGSRV